jgi:hypothetical protein
VERLRDQQKILQQRLGQRKEESVSIIRELSIFQENVKHAVMEEKNKITDLTSHVIEEIEAT